jgi:photosystem II stability/assembly factor-like uncharacterized protein
MKKIVVFFFLLISSFTYPQSGWFQQTSGTNRNLNDIYLLNSNTGWIVGDSIILKTTNGGNNWFTQSVPISSTLLSVFFINENTGFITGNKDYSLIITEIYVFKTTNGGINWILSNKDYSSLNAVTARSSDIWAVSDSTIFKTYSDFPGFASAGRIDKSTNGGVNFTSTLSSGDFSGLCFINSQTGWTTSNYSQDIPPSVFKIYRTTNAGLNWTVMYRDSINAPLMAHHSKQIQYLNSNTGYSLLYGSTGTKLLKTTNGGISWDSTKFNHNKNQAMYFVDVNTGWIGGSNFNVNSNISKTTNAGLNWIDQNIGGTQYIQNIMFVNNMTGWAVGYSGAILKTINGGVSGIIKISNTIPDKFSLYQNYPNPFNPVTKISFDIRKTGFVTLKIYDNLGRELTTLLNEVKSEGTYSVDFDGSDLASGVYHYKIMTGSFSDTKTMLLIK